MSLTFFVVVQQANNFVFSLFNIVDLHLDYERKIAEQINGEGGRRKGEKNRRTKAIADDEHGPWPLKCAYHGGVDQERPITPANFLPEMPELRKKRTVQNKVVEYLTLRLFSKQSIFHLVDILFKDMKDDYKLLEDSGTDEDDENGEGLDEERLEGSREGGGDQSGEESDDPTRANIDIEDYMSIKGVLTIERIKDIVGEIMSSCQKKMKYEILEAIMKGVIFQKKKLRESFMQEILNAQDSASYRLALEAHINSGIKPKQTDLKSGIVDPNYAKKYERIINFNAADINDRPVDEKDPTFRNRLFVLTSKGIHIMENLPGGPGGLRCLTCPLSAFCPRGPSKVRFIDYESIQTVINFP